MTDENMYEIRVDGQMSESWSGWFDGLTVREEGNCTTITGPVVDQAALFGVLAKIDALNIPIVSVIRLTPGQESP
ncbi:MAG: hypothetical protein ACK2UO_07965 [Caldilineaceae bacterium]|jgi:hypothetical protein